MLCSISKYSTPIHLWNGYKQAKATTALPIPEPRSMNDVFFIELSPYTDLIYSII